MVSQVEKYARALVKALYLTTDGKPFSWSLPDELSDVAKEAITFAVDCGWLVLESNSLRLTAKGRDLIVGHRER